MSTTAPAPTSRQRVPRPRALGSRSGEDLRQGSGPGRGRLRPLPRRGARHHRRQRCRQVHADQGRHRRGDPGRRRDPARRRGGQLPPPQEAREAGIETVYQTLAVAPALDIAANMFLGREMRRKGPLGSVLRMLDHKGMRESAGQSMSDLGIGTLQNMAQAVETLSGGQRQAVSVARAAAFATKLIVLDEPTAALGVKETNQVLSMINRVRENGLPVILISHNMPNVFEVADRIHIQRLGQVCRRGHPEVAHTQRGGRDHDGRDHTRGDAGQGDRLSHREG